MVDDLEPGPDPRKIRNPKSRRPDRPERVDAVLRSFNEDRAFSIRRPTEGEANQVKSEINAAVYYLNRWEDYDVRVRPYVTEHYRIDGAEYLADEVTPKTLDDARARSAEVEHYFKTNFWVHKPLPRGFRQMSQDQLESAHQASAEARGVTVKSQAPRHRRTVSRRAD